MKQRRSLDNDCKGNVGKPIGKEKDDNVCKAKSEEFMKPIGMITTAKRRLKRADKGERLQREAKQEL